MIYDLRPMDHGHQMIYGLFMMRSDLSMIWSNDEFHMSDPQKTLCLVSMDVIGVIVVWMPSSESNRPEI